LFVANKGTSGEIVGLIGHMAASRKPIVYGAHLSSTPPCHMDIEDGNREINLPLPRRLSILRILFQLTESRNDMVIRVHINFILESHD